MEKSEQSDFEWQSSIDQSYKVFSKYQCPRQLTAGYSEYDSDVKRILSDIRSADLNKLDFSMLETYASSAVYTVGTVEDFKHFLPRILEYKVGISKNDTYSSYLLSRLLRFSEFTKWPDPEIKVVRQVYRFAWESNTVKYSDICSPPALLIGNISLGNEITPLLLHLITSGSMCALLNLADLVNTPIEQMTRAKSIWLDVPEGARAALRVWLESEAVAEALQFGARSSKDDNLERFLSALMRLGKI